MALNALGYTLTNKTDRHQEALVYIKKAYEISPNDPAIIDSMGWVNYRLGNYSEALKYLRKAISIEPDHEIAAHLGEVLWVSGLEVEAKRVWEEALEKSSDSEVLKSVMEKFIRK
jgi:tetratricopeptide (TPR) repeat protein